MQKFLNKVFVFCLLLLFSTGFLFSQYWQKIVNIPQPYANNYWLDVYFLPSDPNFGWICGFNGMVIRTTDGGNTWRGSTVNAYHLESVHFPTRLVGYVSGVDGIFKSTDGGASWFDITPVGTRDTTTFWGCYFLNENYGVLVGDGCFGRYQHFWLTTDGGTTWSVFIGNETNSGMTDAILYPNGLGYASSSGRIWITQDSGRTWQVFSVSGPELWQEEITNIGSSFLVPYSGTTCTGGGNDGGMRFTTNNGSTWNSFRTGVPMFGTFLIDSQKGWACGYSTEVYYTSNGGINWQKRNCGIQSGNLDDIWFIDENNGWVVGEGVYKLSNPKGVTNKNAINFGEFCVGFRKYDTIWLKNYNFNDVTIALSLNSPTNEFEIVSPGLSGFIQSCDSIRIIVAFVPKTTGIKNGTLTVQYPFQSPIIIPITGSAIQSSAKLLDTIVVLNRAKCGLTYPITAKIAVSTEGEFVSSVVPVVDNPIFKFLTNLPLQLNPSRDNVLNFEVTPKDTGWQVISYRVRFSPCDTFQILTIRVYSVSPIINIDSAIESDFQCRAPAIELPVLNSGNDTLFFRKFSFSPQTNKLILAGWKSGNLLLSNYILPNKSDTLLIYIDSSFTGNLVTTLIIENNDFRSIRGPRNVVNIKINIRVFLPKIVASPTYLDFGKICLGDSVIKNLTFENRGNLEELFLNVYQRDRNTFIITNPFPLNVKAFDSIKVRILFFPTRIGKFIDTLIFVSFNCKDTFKVVCFGEGVRTNLSYFPKQITLRMQKGYLQTQKIEFFTSFPDTFKFVNYQIDGEINAFISNFVLLTDSIATSFDTLSFELTFDAKLKGKYNGSITFVFDGICDTVIIIPISIDVFDKNLVIDPTSIDFGRVLCTPVIQVRKIKIKNLSETVDTILNISILQKFGQFTFETLPSLPLVLNPFDSLELKVDFVPRQIGYDTANILFEFRDTTRNTTIMINAFYGLSKTTLYPTDVDFGEREYCELPVSKFLSITNTGNIPDTIFILKGFTNDVFDFRISRTVLNPFSEDTSFIEIQFKNKDKIGDFLDTLVLGLRNCQVSDTIIISGSVGSPVFSISPNVVEIGELWMGNKKSSGVILNNLFNKPATVSIFSSIISENINFDTAFSGIVQPNSSIVFAFNVEAKQVGEYWDTICFKFTTRCDYYSCFVIHYVIPEENYVLSLKIGKYFSKPDDIVDIKIENQSPNEFLKLDTLQLGLTFDKFLFHPHSYKIENQDVIAQNSFGNIQLLLVGQQLKEFVNNGKPVVVSGRALYSFPDTTNLDLNVVRYAPEKVIRFNLINGFLKVHPICELVGAFRLEEFPTFEILGLYFDFNDTYLTVFSTDKQKVVANCFGLLGNSLTQSVLVLEKGLNVVDISKILSRTFQSSEIYLVLTSEFTRKVVYIPIR